MTLRQICKQGSTWEDACLLEVSIQNWKKRRKIGRFLKKKAIEVLVVINLTTCDYYYCNYPDLSLLVRMSVSVCSWFASDVILCMHY